MPSVENYWAEINIITERLAHSDVGPGAGLDAEWRFLEKIFAHFLKTGDFDGIVTLREELDPLFARDTVTGLKFLQQLDTEAISSARFLDQKERLAHLLGAKGHNLHRQGYHQQSITAFSEAASLYQELNNPWEGMKNRYMTALCFRALGKRDEAHQILNDVLEKVDPDDPWCGQPLQVKAWLIQDTGDLLQTEELLRRAVRLQKQGNNSDILVAGTLTDLAEVVGLQNRFSEAKAIFFQSLTILGTHYGQYNRQVARTKLKMAELAMHQKEFAESLFLLDEADDLIRGYGKYYDLMWRIEMLRTLIFLRLGYLKIAFLKFRATRRYRNELNLSNYSLMTQLISRLRAHNGLPR